MIDLFINPSFTLDSFPINTLSKGPLSPTSTLSLDKVVVYSTLPAFPYKEREKGEIASHLSVARNDFLFNHCRRRVHMLKEI